MNNTKLQDKKDGFEDKIDSEKVEEAKNNELQVQVKTFQKPLTPYQQYKQSKNKNGGKYFQFYDDIKVYTHNIYDW